MTIQTLKRILAFVLLSLAQVLVFNRILLFGCATPLVYVYFIVMFPRSYPKWGILIWSFALGLTIDMFTNTPGVASASLTLAGALQPYVLELFLPRDAEEGMKTTAKNMGWGKFSTLTAILVVIFCLTFFSLEIFNLQSWIHWLQCVFGSSILTTMLILTLENVRK